MEEKFKGSCLCKEIKIEYTGEPFSFNLCHCTMCQKFSGSPFGAYIGIKKDNFNYISGKELAKVFKSSDWASRIFCKKCGSSLMYINHKIPENYFIAGGVFDDEINTAPQKHIFVKDKCHWYDISSDIPQIKKY